jgi:hypothetical protein
VSKLVRCWGSLKHSRVPISFSGSANKESASELLLQWLTAVSSSSSARNDSKLCWIAANDGMLAGCETAPYKNRAPILQIASSGPPAARKRSLTA